MHVVTFEDHEDHEMGLDQVKEVNHKIQNFSSENWKFRIYLCMFQE